MSGLLAVALAALLLQPVGEIKAGDEGAVPFACHTAEDITNFGILVDNRVDGTALISAGNSLILAGRCVYFPVPEPIEFEEIVPAPDLSEHEVWKAKMPDGSEWFMLHKAAQT